MNRLYINYLKFNQSLKTVKSINEVLFLAVATIAFLIAGQLVADINADLFCSLAAGLTFGIILVKLPATMDFLKNRTNGKHNLR